MTSRLRILDAFESYKYGLASAFFDILFHHGIKHEAMGPPYEKVNFGSRKGGFLLTIDGIDWFRTKAFCRIGGHGTITINLKEKFPQGCVSLWIQKP